MSKMISKVMIIAPFLNQSQHVGVLRVRRFIRWLHNSGLEVVVVSAGSKDTETSHDWGREIVVRDPLGLHRGRDGKDASLRRKEYSSMVEIASRILFNPDPNIAWGRAVCRSPVVLSEVRTATMILSSSPPESCHVTAMKLAEKSDASLIVDMRDGWLDEPLKPALERSSFRRWREGRLEHRALSSAGKIFVTSNVWHKMLLNRKPELAGKVVVLPNCYPLSSKAATSIPDADKQLVLMYTGQFRGSKFNNEPGLLLSPLIEAASANGVSLRLVLYGKFTTRDLGDLQIARKNLQRVGGELDYYPPIAHHDMIKSLTEASGLLLLSATMASLPAKLFEYLTSGRPILAATPRDSAVWQLAERVPHMYTLELGEVKQARNVIEDFLAACASDLSQFEVPSEFMDDYCENIFIENLKIASPGAEIQ